MVLAEGPHRAARPLNIGEAPRLDASNDTEFQPDRALADGEVVAGPHQRALGITYAQTLFSLEGSADVRKMRGGGYCIYLEHVSASFGWKRMDVFVQRFGFL